MPDATGTLLAGATRTDETRMTREEREEYQNLINAVNEEARDNWDNLQWRQERAADIRDQIEYNFESESLFREVINYRTLAFEDRRIIRQTRGLKAFWLARGGYIEESQLRTQEFELPRDMIGFHVSEQEDKLRVNFAETSADLVRLGTARLEAEMNRRLIQLMEAAVPSGSPFYVSGAGLSQTAVNGALDGVADMGGGNPNGGALGTGITLLGRQTMTGQITDFSGYSNETLEEIRQKGRLGVYRGANIQTVTNYLDDDNVPYLPANELWVLAGNAGEFDSFGGVLFKESTEDLNWYWHYVARRDVGGMIYFPWRIRRIVDTSITPSAALSYPPLF